MKRFLTRLSLVAVLNLIAFEATQQFTVHSPESTGELLMLLQLVLLIPALAWATLPTFRTSPARILYRAALIPPLFLATYTLTYVYSWHIRPNVGLYEEPDWVANHPGFQHGIRQFIGRNRWH